MPFHSSVIQNLFSQLFSCSVLLRFTETCCWCMIKHFAHSSFSSLQQCLLGYQYHHHHFICSRTIQQTSTNDGFTTWKIFSLSFQGSAPEPRFPFALFLTPTSELCSRIPSETSVLDPLNPAPLTPNPRSPKPYLPQKSRPGLLL